jgi:C6 transcription factor Pro1
MDNGPLQEDMLNQVKREVKEKAAMRRTLGYMRESEIANDEPPLRNQRNTQAEAGAETRYPLRQHGPNPTLLDTSQLQRGRIDPEVPIPASTVVEPSPDPRPEVPRQTVWPGCDPGFKSFYLDFFFPFLFPFYQPHMLEGGRAWLFHFVNESEGMQQTTIALSSYLFSIVLDATEAGHEICKKIGWEKLFAEMANTFTGLSDNILRLRQGHDNADMQLSLAVRILGTIVHLQRFEIATRGFANCNKHLGAAVQCFTHILGDRAATQGTDTASDFFAVLGRMGPSPWPRPYRQFQIASPEQVAFRFFASLLVADDIIASISLAEEPRLYKYHAGLLSGEPQHELPVDLEAVIGCQNWVFLQIGEISALAAWKRRQAGNGDTASELARRGNAIQCALNIRLDSVHDSQDSQPGTQSSELDQNAVLGLFNEWQQPSTTASQRKAVTEIWAYAAMIYLLITLHGGHAMQVEIRQNVDRVVALLAHKLSTPALLRTVAWPFCVAGCLAAPEQEAFFRHQAQSLQPKGLFVTVHKAMEIMEQVWQKRAMTGQSDEMVDDMAGYFGASSEVLFLV